MHEYMVLKVIQNNLYYKTTNHSMWCKCTANTKIKKDSTSDLQKIEPFSSTQSRYITVKIKEIKSNNSL